MVAHGILTEPLVTRGRHFDRDQFSDLIPGQGLPSANLLSTNFMVGLVQLMFYNGLRYEEFEVVYQLASVER